MSHLLKWTLLLAASLLLMPSLFAWNIGAKGRVNGPSIHTTYFLTPNNQKFPVHAQAYVGLFLNGGCVFNAIYNIGDESLKTGDIIDIDAFSLKSVIGLGANCMTIYYTYKQVVSETFQITNDGINYINTNPPIADVTIL